jgi:hypothetical protein
MPRSRGWGADLPSPHIWLTLGYRSLRQGEGEAAIEWDATPEYCFQAPSGHPAFSTQVGKIWARTKKPRRG